MTKEPLLKCFVLSPIGADDSPERATADKVLKYVIKKALSDKYDVVRADDEANPGAITPQFIAAITNADLIVADISGHNPNVFYELAVAHGFNKPTVHIQKKGDKVPFDIKDMRIAPYNLGDPEDLEVAVALIRKYADFAAENPELLQTPLSAARKFETVADSTDPVAESNLRVMEAIEELTQEVKRAIRPRVVRRPQALQVNEDDVKSYRRIVTSAIRHGGLEIADMSNTVTLGTTSGFDTWARKTADEIDPFHSGNVEDVLMSTELRQHIAQQEEDDDERELDFEP